MMTYILLYSCSAMHLTTHDSNPKGQKIEDCEGYTVNNTICTHNCGKYGMFEDDSSRKCTHKCAFLQEKSIKCQEECKNLTLIKNNQIFCIDKCPVFYQQNGKMCEFKQYLLDITIGVPATAGILIIIIVISVVFYKKLKHTPKYDDNEETQKTKCDECKEIMNDCDDEDDDVFGKVAVKFVSTGGKQPISIQQQKVSDNKNAQRENNVHNAKISVQQEDKIINNDKLPSTIKVNLSNDIINNLKKQVQETKNQKQHPEKRHNQGEIQQKYEKLIHSSKPVVNYEDIDNYKIPMMNQETVDILTIKKEIGVLGWLKAGQ